MAKGVERETGIEPATNGLGSRYSTIELLPLAGGNSMVAEIAAGAENARLFGIRRLLT